MKCETGCGDLLNQVDMMGSQQPVSQLQATKAFGGILSTIQISVYLVLKEDMPTFLDTQVSLAPTPVSWLVGW